LYMVCVHCIKRSLPVIGTLTHDNDLKAACAREIRTSYPKCKVFNRNGEFVLVDKFLEKKSNNFSDAAYEEWFSHVYAPFLLAGMTFELHLHRCPSSRQAPASAWSSRAETVMALLYPVTRPATVRRTHWHV
jgi:hypothetical protein